MESCFYSWAPPLLLAHLLQARFYCVVILDLGAIKNATASYNMSFHVMGALMVLSGLIGLPLRKLNAWEKRRANEESRDKVEMQPLNDKEA